MKNIIKKVFTPIIMGVILGSICGKIAYKIYSDDLENKFSTKKVYILEYGTYNTFDNMKEDNNQNNYIYYIDNNQYKSIVGITKNENNIEKIKKLYNTDLKVKEFYIEEKEINEKQDEFDQKLSNSTKEEDTRKLLDDIINLYKEDDNMRLISIK
ncbi:MAG: hypothetical protein SO067_02535 [Bacilli bacterium]|jgi:hypothetical protein|nr:hypothetical protein [Clostridium sp.]MDY3797982.1 hypothetical protein [Bacilli bacterium]CDE95971.1 unknown [Clostridium sp. CAG:914]